MARQFSRQYQLITRPQRLQEIAVDLVRHFVNRGFRGKAMYVAINKATAVRMYNLVQAEWARYQAELEVELADAPEAGRPHVESLIDFMSTTDMAVVVSQAQNEVADMAAAGLDIAKHRKRMVIESSTEAPDISGVIDSVSELLDRSVGAKEYIIGTGGEADPLIDLNRLDFEQLILRFGGRKRTAAKAIQRDIEARLDEAVRKNPTRLDFAEQFRRLIDEYSAVTHNLEEFLRRLKAINDELTDEEQRAVQEGMSEEELAIFDLLTKPEPDLTRAQTVEVKVAAKKLLDRIADELVLDWKRKQKTRSAVKVAVRNMLDNELPDVYERELFDRKVNAVYEHIYTSYHNNGESVYS